MTEILHRVGIDLGDRSYPILIGSGLLSSSAIFAQCPKATQAVIVTNTTVAPLYAAQLQAALAAHLNANVQYLSSQGLDPLGKTVVQH